MATAEHKRLADVVKQTHSLLRKEYRQYGAEVAWKNHIMRTEVLQKYAVSMQKLATECWMHSKLSLKTETHCRIEWIRNQCKEYFLDGGKERYDKREQEISTKIIMENSNNQDSRSYDNANNHVKSTPQNSAKQKISVLDVGSCYNSLSIEDAFHVTAIDLMPVSKEVFRCDFLSIAIGKEQIVSEDELEVHQLPANFFDTVVFSLFLEYLPCSKQRYLCCKKAYDLLKYGSILVIISPDSKHVGANAKFMKSWRYTLSQLGFMRIKYEKLRHIHCLVFRKCWIKDVAKRWAGLQHFSANDLEYISNTNIFIPQDFQTIHLKENEEKIEFNKTDLVNTFAELPFDNEDI